MEKEIKNSYEIFIYIYNIIKNDLNNMINFENSKNDDEIEIKNIINLICNSLSLDYELQMRKYFKNIYVSSFKNYEEFLNHYVENTLFIYVLQNDKLNIYKVMIQDYFKNVVESVNGIINKSPNIFNNIKFYYNIYKTIQSNTSENNIIHINDIGTVLSPRFYMLSIIYIFTDNIDYFDIIIKTILNKDYFIEIVKLVNNMIDIISCTINNNQFETYQYILSKYFEIILKYQNSISINYNKAKNEFKNIILQLNNNIIKKINVLSYLKVVLSYFSKDELEKMCNDYKELLIVNNKFRNIDITFGYFDLIGYNKYDFNDSNYSNKLYILINLSTLIDYKDGIEIYEQISIHDKNKYFLKYLDNNINIILDLFRMNNKYIYIDSILDYLIKNNIEYINKFLININHDNYKEQFIGIKKFIVNPIIWNVLNDDSHIKLLTIILETYNINNDENKEIINIYIKNMKENEYKFSSIDTETIINKLYEKNKDLLLYILQNYEHTNSELIINLCNNCVNKNDMDLFMQLYNIFSERFKIDIYEGIMTHINNFNFITYIKNNEIIKSELKKYVNYKKDYLINIDEKIQKMSNFKCKCNICNLFYINKKSNYKNANNYNPVFYYCSDCNMNLHDDCLFEVIKNNRSKIKKCVFCESKNIENVKFSTAEYKYILYNKLLNDFDFNIYSLE